MKDDEKNNTDGSSGDISEKFTAALKEGAQAAGEQIMAALNEYVKPSSIFAEKFAAALRIGAQRAGSKLIEASIEYVESVKRSKASNDENK